jgi:hypothetical protein
MEVKMSEKPTIKLVETAPDDVFNDLEGLRKAATLTVSRRVVATNVKVGKPPNNVYFRTHPDPAFALDAWVVVGDGGSDDFHFVAPNMLTHPTMLPRRRKVTIATVYSWPGGVISLWPVPFADTTRIPVWKSYRAAFELSKTQWVQLVWNADRRDADVAVAENISMEPTWPADLDLAQLLKLGFADKIIDSPEHPYVISLRGIAE